MQVLTREIGYRDTALGRLLYIKVWADGYPLLGWLDVWQAFASAYPGKWAIEVYPPADQLVNGKHMYHLFVCEEEPAGLNIR